MADRAVPLVRLVRRMRRGLGPRAAVGFAVCAVGLAACASGRFDGTSYRGDGFGFRIPQPPPSWEPIDVSHAALAFRDPTSRATILLNGRCGQDAPDVPLSALTNHLFLEFTDREVKLQEVVPFDGREAMHTSVVAKLDGVPMAYDVWVLKKDGCVYDLIYLAPPADAERGLEAFRKLVHGFATVEPDGG
jgi:hypothetical protein